MDRLSTGLLLVAGVALAGLLLPVTEATAQPGLSLENDTLTQSVLIHPPVDAGRPRLVLTTREHTYRSQLGLGDQLGRDFIVARVGKDGIPRAYKPGTNGKQNEDWHGWRRDVLAPFDGTVAETTPPDSTHAPGAIDRDAQPGTIIFEDSDGKISTIYVHVREITVEEGQSVRTGEVVGKVGNNAISRTPHLHVGAWKGDASRSDAKKGTPLQIQMDLYARERSGEGKTGQ
jgi:murein DD-endopeptidase MepM/ murein hydrolase activator NlpD